jgi:hypothetical protein
MMHRLVAWDESIGGRRVAAARALERAAGGSARFGEAVRLAEGPALYPVLAATNTGILAVWTTGGDPSRVALRTIRLP